MNHVTLGTVALGIWEMLIILLVLLVMSGLAVGAVLLVVWLVRRQQDRAAVPPTPLSDHPHTTGRNGRFPFAEVHSGQVRIRWGSYIAGLAAVVIGGGLLNGLLLVAGVWSGVDTVLFGLLVAVVAFHLFVIRDFHRAGRARPVIPSPPTIPPTQPSPPVASPPAACPRCGATLPADSPQGLCPRCVMGVGFATETEATGQCGPHGTKIVPPPEAEVARRFPHLEILGCLGHGGMGVVYKARQPKLNRLVALKILAPEKGADPKFAERFLREAQALARLSHPNIVTVHDFGEADGMFFLLMEFVDGMTLRQLLREARMKPEEALAIVPKICEALQFAHEQGVVHRDIKPENVLLDKQGRVKIADFGIAKIINPLTRPADTLSPSNGERDRVRGAGLTQDHILGTPHYMAPEQVEKPQLVDHRADIYSLGVVFYEMLTGELPLGKFQPPSKKVQVDVRLDEVVLHALEKEPERRYQQASQVKTDVENIACKPPPSAPTLDSMAVAKWRRHLQFKYGCLFFAALCFLIATISFALQDNAIAALLSGVAVVFLSQAGYRHWVAAKQLQDTTSPTRGGQAGESLTEHPHRPATAVAQSNALEATIVFAGTFLFAFMLAVVRELSRASVVPFKEFWILLAIVGLIICALSLAGIWPFPSPWFPEPNFSSRNLRRNRAKGDSERDQKPHFSRTAIVGACWSVFGILAALFWLIARQEGGPGQTPTGLGLFLFVTLVPLGVTSLLGTTILGGVAISQIRHSRGRLYGLGLAVFDALLFPLLALDALIVGAGFMGLKLGVASHIARGPAVEPTVWASYWWLGLVVLGVIVLVDWLIIRAVWRAANKPVGGGSAPVVAPAAATPSRSGSGGKVVAVIVAVVLLVLAVPVGSMLLAIYLPYLARHQALSAEALVSVEQKLAQELKARLQEANFDAASVSVNINPRRRDRGECVISGLVKYWGVRPQEPGIQRLYSDEHGGGTFRHEGRGLWLFTGNGALQRLRFHVDASAEMSDAPGVTQPASAIRSLVPKAAHIGRNDKSVMLHHDDVDLHYALFYAGDFNSSSRSSHNPRTKNWKDDGGLTLRSGRTFGYLRESDSPDRLRINGREYDLRQGRVFTLHDDGTANQLALFPPLAVARDLGELARLVAGAPAGLTFGPVVERIVQTRLSGTTNWFLDLESGQFLMPPPELAELLTSPTGPRSVEGLPGTRREQFADWANKTGVDLLVWGPTSLQTVGGLWVMTHGPSYENWDDLDWQQPAAARRAIQDFEEETRDLSLQEKASRFGIGPHTVLARNFSALYFFKTQQGTIGVLQFAGTNRNPAGMKIRYKLAQAAPVNAPVFGPVTERVVNDDGAGSNFFIDLDTGKLLSPPADLKLPGADPREQKAFLAWVRESGIDAMGETSVSVRGLVGMELIARPVPGPLWEKLPPQVLQADDALTSQGTPGTASFLSAKGELPETFLFKTREGGVGLLQITGFTESPRGVNIRYKLVQDAPANGLVFGPVIERELPDPDNGSGRGNRETLRLRTGERLSVLDDAPKESGGRLRALAASQGDLFVEYDDFVSGRWALVTAGLKFSDLLPRQWETATLAELDEALRQPSALQRTEHSGAALYLLPEGLLPLTLALESRNGERGLLQITGFTDNPRGVKMRYKLVQAAPASEQTFGPVIERHLSTHLFATNNRVLDLDTGQVLSVPNENALYVRTNDLFVQNHPRALFDWLVKTRADLFATDARHELNLHLDDGWLAPLTQRTNFEQVTASELEHLLPKQGISQSAMLQKTNAGAVPFAFRTREGASGLLQIAGFTGNPPGAKIRYKLVQAAAKDAPTRSLPTRVRLMRSDYSRNLWCWRVSRTPGTRLVYGVLDVTDPERPRQVLMAREDTPLATVSAQDFTLRLHPERGNWRVEIEDAWSGENGGRGAAGEKIDCPPAATLRAANVKPFGDLAEDRYHVFWRGELVSGGEIHKRLSFVARLARPDDPIRNILDASDPVRNLDENAPGQSKPDQEQSQPRPEIGLRFKALFLGIPLLLLGALAVVGTIVWITLAARHKTKPAIIATAQPAAPAVMHSPQPQNESAVGTSRAGAGFTVESVRSQFVILTVMWWTGLPLSIVAEFLPPPGDLVVDVLSLPLLVLMAVYWCILLYRHWSLLQGHGARTTPGKAVGFGFIPFYCFYWWFVAYVGLATDNNRYLAQVGITTTRMSRGLAITYCVLGVLGCTIGLIPMVGAVVWIPYTILGFIPLCQQRNCVLAILQHRTAKLVNEIQPLRAC